MARKNILPKEAMILDFGNIKGVHFDRLSVQIDKTNFSDINRKKMYIHLDNIKVFNIEKASQSSISIRGNIESDEE